MMWLWLSAVLHYNWMVMGLQDSPQHDVKGHPLTLSMCILVHRPTQYIAQTVHKA